MNMKKYGFEAMIQQVNVKSLRTGDKSVRITLEIDSPPKDFVSRIDEFHRADRMIGVAFAERPKK
jgi:hypothetical protein